MKPEEVTDEMMESFRLAKQANTTGYVDSVAAGIAAAITVYLRDAGRGQLQPLELAMKFHDYYERLAPSFGYETRPDTKVFDPTSKNGRLMVAVCGEILNADRATPAKNSFNADAQLKENGQSLSSAVATGDGWTYYKIAKGDFPFRSRIKGNTVQYFHGRWKDGTLEEFQRFVNQGLLVLDPIQTESGEPEPTPADAPSDATAESISRLLEIKSFPGVCCGTMALCDYLISELRKEAK